MCIRDRSFTISFSISRELLDAAKDAGVSQEELVAIVLGVGVVFTAFPRTLSLAYKTMLVVRGSEKGEDKGADDDGGEGGSFWQFITILASLIKRISASVAVQLLAQTVVTKQPLRSVRITLLLGVVAYFLFLSESSRYGSIQKKK